MNRREAILLAVKVLLQKGYEWLACDADGTIVTYEVKPLKMTEEEWWNYDSEEPKFLTLDNAHDINFVKWEDDEPVNIREWLEKEEEEMKMYSVKDGELECREVDADFFEKNTTLGGLLTPKEVELDLDNCGESTLNIIETEWFSDSSTYDANSKHPPLQITLDDLNNVQIHGKICQELTETYEKKNADYGNSFENSLDKHGLIAGIVRMDDKMSRLISLNSKNEQQVMDESLRDTLMDLANYAIMSVMWLDEQ